MMLMYEALVNQLVKKRIILNLDDEMRENLAVLRDTCLSQESRTAAHVALEDDPDLERFITNWFTHVEGSDMALLKGLPVHDIMQNVHAVHICNLDEYVSSLHAMLPRIVAYNPRYGRWLPDFWAMLTALPADQVTLLQTNFAQPITGNPSYSNMAWDMWIECTMHKGSQMKSGWISILQNE